MGILGEPELYEEVFLNLKNREKIWRTVSWHQQDPTRNIESVLMEEAQYWEIQKQSDREPQGSLTAGNRVLSTQWK